MKRITSLLLVLLLVFALLPGQSFAARNTGKAIQLVNTGSQSSAANLVGAQESSLWFGSYQQSSGRNRDAQASPVKWRVLDNSSGQLYLLADQNLDAHVYHNADETVSWLGSDIRSWLNDGENGFLKNAFTAAEAALLAEAEVEPSRGENEDRVFLLSALEAKVPEYGFTDDASRTAQDTAYAIAQGSSDGWWLRTPGSANSSAAYVEETGAVNETGLNVTSTSLGVRPAVKLNLSSALFSSAAEGGKRSGRKGPGALQKVGDYAGSEWKLTLLDSSRSFSVTEQALTSESGETVELHYTGATPYDAAEAPNEYVSAMILDQTPSILFYGRLVQPSAADGTLQLTLPADSELPAGSYSLLVFSEQYNGDKKTDFASTISVLTLKIKGDSYTVRFLNYDGSILKETQVQEGETPVYDGETPRRPSTAEFDYSFIGWSPALGPVTSDTTYRPVFNETPRKYTVRFVNENDEILQSDSLNYGETPAYTGPTPTLPRTAQYTYTFSRWSPEITPVTKDATYTAQYSRTENEYTVTFYDEDGITVLQTVTLPYGTKPEYNGEKPTKDPTDEYVFTFAGWDKELVEVIGPAFYTATYTRSPREYYIRFLNYDNQELQKVLVPYGTVPEYTGETPTRPATAEYTYTFAGWTPEIEAVTTEKTYTAVYTQTEIVTYTVTQGAEGSWVKGSSGSYLLTVKRSPNDAVCFDHYKETWIDDTQVTVTAKAGSTVIAIDANVLNKLGIGPHTITVKFDDGEAEASLTVKTSSGSDSAYNSGSGGNASPHTGTARSVDLWIGSLIVVGLALGIVAVVMIKRRRSSVYTITIE